MAQASTEIPRHGFMASWHPLSGPGRGPEALNQGRTQQLWRVDVRDDGNRLLAHGEVRLQNLDPTAG